jgi:hypothetical protein
VALVSTGLTLWMSAGTELPKRLPGIALGSPFLLHAERALIVGAGLTALLIFAARGWVGYFPSKISTGGAEYLHRPAVTEVVESERAVQVEIDRLKTIHRILAKNMQDRLYAVESEIAALRSRLNHQPEQDDML